MFVTLIRIGHVIVHVLFGGITILQCSPTKPALHIRHKTFAVEQETAKVFPLESFAVYGI